MRRRRIGLLITGLACTTGLLAAGPAAAAPGSPPDPTPLDLSEVQVDESLRRVRGPVEVIVRLSEPSLAATLAEDALTTGQVPDTATQQAQVARVTNQQNAVASKARALGGSETARVAKSLNAVAFRIDASRIDALASVAGVVSVRPVARYHTNQGAPASGSLAQAAQYLGADKVRAAGFDGTGVRVAVLDSGIDFTHFNLGGPGTEAVYDTCYAQNTQPPSGACAALFGPSAPKVKGGYDFVGETWTGEEADGPEVPDPNPIDLEGHGTHVSDIIGGRSADGSHLGIAPGVELYGVKVCSAVGSSCSGTGLLEGVDWALDPNGDGNIADAVDIMNLSLGSDYGQPEDDLTLALEDAAKLGVTIVASAGNGGDQPFKVGSPSTTPRVISVAQTALPDDSSIPIQVTSPSGIPTINLTTLVSWSPAPAGVINATLQRPAGVLGCVAADFAGFTAGRVALIDRGTCAVSEKAQFAQAAGAIAVILRNNVAGAPPDFSFGGGVPVTIPVLVVGRTPGTTLVNAVAAGPVTVRIDPAAAQSLRGTIAGSSSRGPVQFFSTIKPDIGAPGAWLSAEVGTGNEETGFGGTSGAAPTVAGVAALVLDRFPNLPPASVKVRLLNAADTGNLSLTEFGVRYPTPITRIGAGEVRAEGAVFNTSSLRVNDKANGNISLGLPHLASKLTIEKQLNIRNNDSVPHSYTLTPSYRDPADAALGAIAINVPNSVNVGPNSAKTFTVKFRIDPAKLEPWPLTGLAGPTGEDGLVLNGPELDGWFTATSNAGEKIHLGWQVLPHRSADVAVEGGGPVVAVGGKGELSLRNKSKVLDGSVEVFSLTGTSPRKKAVPAPGSNESRVDLLAVGVRDLVTSGGTPLIEFGFHGAGRKSIPALPVEYDIDLDTNRDGDPDFNIFNALLSTGQTGTVVISYATGQTVAIFLSTVADYDSANMSYFLPLSVLGLTAGQTVDFSATAYQNYFEFAAEDSIEDMSFTVGQPKYSVVEGPTLVVPAGQKATFTVEADNAASSSELGLLLLYNDAAQKEAETVRVRS